MAQVRASDQRPTLFRRIVLGKEAYSTWERGVIGEQLVHESLMKLATKDPRWRHINSIPFGGGEADLDHLVIGPGGIYVVNKKYHRGCTVWVNGDTVTVNGTTCPYVAQARRQAKAASEIFTRAGGFDVPGKASKCW